MRKGCILFFLICIVIFNIQAQDKELYICNWNNPKKITHIKKNDKISIDIISILDTNTHKFTSNFLSGKLLNSEKDKLQLQLDMEIISHGKGKYAYDKFINYEMADSVKNNITENIRTVNFSDISFIHYKPYKGRTMSSIGTGLAIASVVYALFAPLTCINYMNGDFNQHLYYNSLAVCGIGLSAGILTIALFNKNKFFSIVNNKPANINDKNIYRIEIK